MAEILDGRKTSKELLLGFRDRVDALVKKHVEPKLAVILVGNNPSSLAYIRQKQKACDTAGVAWEQHDFQNDVLEETVIEKIKELNDDDTVHGILLQLPLPASFEVKTILAAINSEKDVDCFSGVNVGKFILGFDESDFMPCTARGVIFLLETYGINVEGKHVVVVGRSNLVGKPLSVMMINKGATVTVCNSKTPDLASFTRQAEILCVATGKKQMIKDNMVKKGAVVVDIGINKDEDEKLIGDVDFDEVSKIASYISPVPGGVGPMTVACLIENVIKSAERVAGKNSRI